jgi:hypothetical protein
MGIKETVPGIKTGIAASEHHGIILFDDVSFI